MKFFLIHGAYGNPQENWFPWLKNELESLGHEVIAPSFPTPEGQELASWLKIFDQYKEQSDGAIFIAHSLGPAFVLNLIAGGTKPEHCFFVAPFYKEINNPDFDEVNSSFMNDFDWDSLASLCSYTCYFSDNDSYVPFENSKSFAERLKAEIKLIPGAGHINSESGYARFPLLLEDIKSIL